MTTGQPIVSIYKPRVIITSAAAVLRVDLRRCTTTAVTKRRASPRRPADKRPMPLFRARRVRVLRPERWTVFGRNGNRIRLRETNIRFDCARDRKRLLLLLLLFTFLANNESHCVRDYFLVSYIIFFARHKHTARLKTRFARNRRCSERGADRIGRRARARTHKFLLAYGARRAGDEATCKY